MLLFICRGRSNGANRVLWVKVVVHFEYYSSINNELLNGTDFGIHYKVTVSKVSELFINSILNFLNM